MADHYNDNRRNDSQLFDDIYADILCIKDYANDVDDSESHCEPQKRYWVA